MLNRARPLRAGAFVFRCLPGQWPAQPVQLDEAVRSALSAGPILLKLVGRTLQRQSMSLLPPLDLFASVRDQDDFIEAAVRVASKGMSGAVRVTGSVGLVAK